MNMTQISVDLLVARVLLLVVLLLVVSRFRTEQAQLVRCVEACRKKRWCKCRCRLAACTVLFFTNVILVSAGRCLADDTNGVVLDFRATPVRAVVEMYSRLVDRHAVYAADLPDGALTFTTHGKSLSKD